MVCILQRLTTGQPLCPLLSQGTEFPKLISFGLDSNGVCQLFVSCVVYQLPRMPNEKMEPVLLPELIIEPQVFACGLCALIKI